LAPALRAIAGRVQLTIEMGRFFATECGTYLTAVNDLKANDGVNYCIVDGGINHLTFIGQLMGMKVPIIENLGALGRAVAEPLAEWCVCGSLCFHFLFTGSEVRYNADDRKDESHSEIAEISREDLAVFKEIGNCRNGFKIGQSEIHFSCSVPFLICEVDIVCNAGVPSDCENRHGDDDGENEANFAFFFRFSEKRISLYGTDDTDQTAERREEAELPKYKPKDTAYEREQERADCARKNVFFCFNGSVIH
jgi:hypothetical protein